MNELTFTILKIVTSISSVLIVRYLIPYLKNKIKRSDYELALSIVESAVRAAEQTIKGSGKGAVKKEEVVNWVHNWLNENGFKISDEQLDILIEEAVYVLNH